MINAAKFNLLHHPSDESMAFRFL